MKTTCFEASGGWTKRQIILIYESTRLALSLNKGRFQKLSAAFKIFFFVVDDGSILKPMPWQKDGKFLI